VTIALVPSTPAAAAEIGPLQIINYNSGLCLDVKERSTSNGALFASGPAAASQTSCGGFTSSRQETATSSIYSRSARFCATRPDVSPIPDGARRREKI
jgi:hypothetical protein